MEALARLTEEGLLREVRGELEFRNELIRAQAYYSIAASLRQQLHKRVADLLAARTSTEGKGSALEIAWQYLRGGDPASARSEEHTSELQSQSNLVCRLLLEKKK